MASQNAINKDLKKKKQKKIIMIAAAIAYVVLVWILLHYQSVSTLSPRATLDEKVGMAFIHMFTHPFDISITASIIWLLLGGTALGACAYFIRKSNHELRKHDNPKDVYGDGHFMTLEENEDFNKRRNEPFGEPTADPFSSNAIIAEKLMLSLNGYKARLNANMAAFGASGAGKSRNLAAPNLLQFNANYVITDPSGELLRQYGKALENAGYEVSVFNISSVYEGNRYNPFVYLHSEKDILVFVRTLIRNTTPPKDHAGDPFWEKSETMLIYSLMLYIWHVFEPEKQTFQALMNMLSMAEVDENDDSATSPLDALFEELERLDPRNLAVKQYSKLRKSAGRTLKSILLSVAVRLSPFELIDMEYLTSKDEMDFEHFGDTKKALFVVIPTEDDTFNFIVSLLYSQLFATLYTYVEQTEQYGWTIKAPGENIKVFHASSLEDSARAEAEAKALLNDIRGGVKISHNKTKDLYEVRTKGGKALVGWRGTKEAAKAFATSLQHVVMERNPGPLKKSGMNPTLPNHVRFILDEFANIGQIPGYSKKLATIRKYNMSNVIILQSLAQLKESYDKEWSAIMGNCDTWINLGARDDETNKYFTDSLEKKAATVENMSFNNNYQGSTSFNNTGADLMTPAQLGRMDIKDCLCLIRGEVPYYGRKYDVEKHPNYKEAMLTDGKFSVPISPAHKKQIELMRLPYRIRKNLQEKDFAGAEEVPELTPSEITPISNIEEVPMAHNVLNTAAKKEAEEINKSIKVLEEMEALSDEETEVISASLQDFFDVKEGDSKEVIKEKVESKLEIEHIDETIFFEEV